MREMGEEVISHEHADEDKVIDNPLQVEARAKRRVEFEGFKLQPQHLTEHA